jgi:SNF2 family DNA or RNA helicase
VTIYRLVTKHTIEEGIVELHQHKRELADSLLEGTDAAARMSPQDMLAMLEQGMAR